ncbi:MAG: AAA family ATPase [Candidatus Micrarchaeia archaeon]
MKLVITGSPGSGKTVLAKKISRLLNAELIDLNKVALKRKFYSKQKGVREKLVNVDKLGKYLKKELLKKNSFVAEGHLACEFFIPSDAVLVLRAEPSVLKRRMNARKYPKKKIKENLLAEALDYCLLKTESNYPKTKIVQINFSKPFSAKIVLQRIQKGESDAVDFSNAVLDKKIFPKVP